MYHLAQLNVATAVAPLDSPVMADFMAASPVVNALADASPGFVWRMVDDEGVGSTGLRPFGADLLVNLSVWETVEALSAFTYRSQHLESLRRRREWFHRPTGPHLVLWWVPAGHRPTTDEAGERLALLAGRGPGPDAFTLREPFPAPGEKVDTVSA